MNPEALRLAERYSRLSAQLEQQAIDRMDAALDASYRELEREFLKRYPQMQAEGNLLARQRSAVLMDDLSGLLQIVRPSRADEYEQLLNRLVRGTGQLGGDLAGELMRAIEPGNFIRNFAGIPLEAVALQARDGARRLYRYNDDFRSKASAIVEQSLILGSGPQKAARLLRAELGVTKSKAETIARTETLSALNDAAQLRYQENNVEAVQLCTTIGDVCPFCVARNMQVYEVGKIRVPLHPRCRCVLLPFKKSWQEQGLTDDEFSQQYRSERLAELGAQGQEPRYGVSPFEKASGLTQPPIPIWKP